MNGLKIVNGRIITTSGIVAGGCVIVENNVIVAVGDDPGRSNDLTVIDADGCYISPGFIDLHTHGGGGYDFMDGTEEAFLEAGKIHAEHGTTTLTPTLLAGSREAFMKSYKAYESVKERVCGQFLGMHIEGPYFSMEQRGAQDPAYIRNPDPKEYLEIIDQCSDILRWDAAPECPGFDAFAGILKEKGILLSIAHSNADYDKVLHAFNLGAGHITHLYSGMSGVHRKNAFRYAGVIESAFIIDDMTVEIIADGKHLPPSLLKLVYKIKGPSRIALVTDSMRAAGMSEGEYSLGSLSDGQRVIVEDGVAKLPDRTAFAGSVATADCLIRTMIDEADISLVDTVRMMSETPADIMGIQDRKGSLAPGKDADIIIFDSNINIQKTIINGNLVFSRS